MRRQELFNTIAGCKEYIIVESDNKTSRLKRLLSFVNSIELNHNDINNLAIDFNVISEAKDKALKYIEDYNDGDVISLSNHIDYKYIRDELLSIIQFMIPNNYFISIEDNKIIAKQIQSYWSM